MWSSFGWSSCGGPLALLCMEVGAGRGAPLPPARAPTSGKRIFVTSSIGQGDLGSWTGANGRTGLEAGDAICMQHAAAGGLSGTYKAWLSASGVSATSRLAGDGPWVRLDGELIAANRAELTSGLLRTAILQTENGAMLEPGKYAWTGTSSFGTITARTCQNWTAAWGTPQAVGEVGSPHSAGSEWTAMLWSGDCYQAFAIYCVEQ
jgi:hypothetical protein